MRNKNDCNLVKKILCIILFIFVIFNISNNSMATEEKIELNIQTDKEQYGKEDEVLATIIVNNNESYDVKNVEIKAMLPQGIKQKDEENLQKQVSELKAGESEQLQITLINVDTVNSTIPQTGKMAILIMLVIITISITIVTYRKHKKINKIIMLFLCFMTMVGIGTKNYAETINKTIQTNKDIVMDNKTYNIVAEVNDETKIKNKRA